MVLLVPKVNPQFLAYAMLIKILIVGLSLVTRQKFTVKQKKRKYIFAYGVRAPAAPLMVPNPPEYGTFRDLE